MASAREAEPMKDSTIVVESVRKLLRRGATVHLLNMLVKVRPADLAEAFESLDEEEKSAAFRLLAERAIPQAAALLGLIHAAHRTDVLRDMSPEKLAPVLGAVLPMSLKTIHVDPAVATSPFVTTAVD